MHVAQKLKVLSRHHLVRVILGLSYIHHLRDEDFPGVMHISRHHAWSRTLSFPLVGNGSSICLFERTPYIPFLVTNGTLLLFHCAFVAERSLAFCTSAHHRGHAVLATHVHTGIPPAYCSLRYFQAVMSGHMLKLLPPLGAPPRR